MPLWKRIFDLAFTLALSPLTLPLLLGSAVLVRLSSPGPVLFRQQRTGWQGRPFEILKFRTLRADSDPSNQDIAHLNEREGPAFKIHDDPRATPVGTILRSSGLDELPQIWNILKGEMSWVGPRPLPCAEAAACTEWRSQRHNVLPGVTCLWQISGREMSFDEWMELDVEYTEKLSLHLDLQILLSTPKALLERILGLGKL